MAQRFVRSILSWRSSLPRNEYRDIAEVILDRLSEQLAYTPIGSEDRKSQQMRILADVLASWIVGLLMEVAERHRDELEERCLRMQREAEERELEAEEEAADADEKGKTFGKRTGGQDDEEEDEESEKDDKDDEDVKKDKDEDEERDGGSEGKRSTEAAGAAEALEDQEGQGDAAGDNGGEEDKQEKKGEEEPPLEEAAEGVVKEEEAGTEQVPAAEIKVEQASEIVDSLDQPGEEDKEEEVEKSEIGDKVPEIEEEERIIGGEVPEADEEQDLAAAASQITLLSEPGVLEDTDLESEAMDADVDMEDFDEGVEAEQQTETEPKTDAGTEMAPAAKILERKELEEIVSRVSAAFNTDVPFVTFLKVFETLYAMLEHAAENSLEDPLENRIHRAIYEKFEEVIRREEPTLLTEPSKDLVDVTAGKLARWLRRTLDERQIGLLEERPATVESTEVRDWSKWIGKVASMAEDWSGWIDRVTAEASGIKEAGGVTRGAWQDWTSKFESSALLWRRTYLEAVHQEHHNTMMLSDRKVTRTGERQQPINSPLFNDSRTIMSMNYDAKVA